VGAVSRLHLRQHFLVLVDHLLHAGEIGFVCGQHFGRGFAGSLEAGQLPGDAIPGRLADLEGLSGPFEFERRGCRKRRGGQKQHAGERHAKAPPLSEFVAQVGHLKSN
jgi:hypothetical protein